MPMPGPAAIIDERSFVPRTIEEAQQLYDGLIDVGVPVAVARGIVTWLIVLPERRADDPASNQLRSQYRQALLRLGVPPWEPNGDMGAYLSSRAAKTRRKRSRNRPGSQRRRGGCFNQWAA